LKHRKRHRIVSMNQNSSLPESFGISPILGYRSWDLRNSEVLLSAYDHSEWPVDAPMEAKCPRDCPVVPSVDICGWKYDVMGYRPGRGCGLYANLNPDHVHYNGVAVRNLLRWRTEKVQWGAVEAYGRIVMHESGLRAEKMRIIALADCGRHSHAYAEAYGVPCLKPEALKAEFSA
jgi:hypothetical protein